MLNHYVLFLVESFLRQAVDRCSPCGYYDVYGSQPQKKSPIPILPCSWQLPTSPDLFLLLSGWLEAVDEPGDDDALSYAGAEQKSSADQLPLVDVEVGVVREDAVPVAWKSVDLNIRLPVFEAETHF